MRSVLWLAAILAGGCGGGARPTPTPRATGPGFDLHLIDFGDAAVEAQVRADATAGVARIEDVFGAPFPRRFEVRVLPDRAALDQQWAVDFGEPAFRSECWMVGMGLSSQLSILSPARWGDQACDHDPADARAIAGVIAHELVHTYHGQINRTIDEDGDKAAAIAWFVEGVAVFASGQLDDHHLAPASEAIAAGKAPARLADAWTGKYRYGVAGSIVAFIDATAGRAALVRMLAATSQDELLAIVGLDEPTLLARWQAWVTATGAR